MGHEVAWKRVLARGTGALWWPFGKLPHPIFCFQRSRLVAAALKQKVQLIDVSLLYTAHLVPLRAGGHSRREEVDIVGVKFSPELGLGLGP